ncbi:MAG: hypothetical protein WCE64_00205 [Bacteroidales bacterium]
MIFEQTRENRDPEMKKCLSILVLLYAIAVTGHSQQEVKRTIFGASAGISLPYNEFAVKKLIPHAGFASAGPNMEASLLRYTGRFFGLSSAIGYSNIFISEKDFLAEYNNLLNGYGENRISAGNYQVLQGMLGLIFKVPEFRNTDILLMGHLGCALTVHPNINVTNSKLGVISSIRKDRSFSPLSNAGIRINHWLTGRYGLSLGYSVNLTRPSFTDETSINGYFFLPVRYHNLNVGFVMNLSKTKR